MKKVLPAAALAVLLTVLMYAVPGSSQISPSSPRGTSASSPLFTKITDGTDTAQVQAGGGLFTATGSIAGASGVSNTVLTPSDDAGTTALRYFVRPEVKNAAGTFDPLFDFTRAEDSAHTSGDVGVPALWVRKDGAAQGTSADTEYSPPAVDAYNAAFVRRDHPNRIRCTVTVSTATTLQAVGGSCAAPGAGLSIYITDILFSTNAAGIAADTFNTLKYGTGGTCGTGTTVFWGAFTTAAVQANVAQTLATPIKIPANNEVCWINSTAGSKFLVLSGFIAP